MNDDISFEEINPVAFWNIYCIVGNSIDSLSLSAPLMGTRARSRMRVGMKATE